MLNEIKEMLLDDTDKLIELLETFDFAHIHRNSKEIRFARDEDGGQNISIRLLNNDYINVKDYVRSESLDIFSYIIKEKNTNFATVIQTTKSILSLGNDWKPKEKLELFGGIYNHISKSDHFIQLKVYDESVLNIYESIGNLRFLKDGISLEAQEFFNIKFSNIDNRIIIPIYNEWGELVGAKGRYNGETTEEMPKYIYPIPVMASYVLYGYSENYEFLYNATEIFIGESEKFVMQCYTMGIRNCVGLGNHSVSEKQAKLLLQLHPKNVILMLDEGLDLYETKKNANTIKKVFGIFDISVKFFDYRFCFDVGEKESPSDNGIEIWNEIIENYIRDTDELTEEDYGI